MDHKGSIKYVINEWRPDGPDFEGTFEVAGPKDGRDQQRGRLPPIDAKIKLKHARTKTGKYNSPLDPHDIVLTFVNNYRHGREWISMPSMEMRDPKQVEAILKMTTQDHTNRMKRNASWHIQPLRIYANYQI